MAWRWDYFPTYDLRQDDLERYLVRLFGNFQFFIEVGFHID